MKRLVLLFVGSLGLLAFSSCSHHSVRPTGDASLSSPGEWRVTNLRQMTWAGSNAEAYWSFDGQWLTLQHQSTKPGEKPECDQIYELSVDGKDGQRVSNGKGRTTCSFFYPNNSRILYSSTFQSGDACPIPPKYPGHEYVWPIYNTYQVYSSKPDGTDLFALEAGAPSAYNAETTVCHDGSVIFTSDRDGDLDLYTGKLDQFNVLTQIKRVTHTVGYDGGAFFSPDCKQIVWRASRPRPGKETKEYRELLEEHLVKPTQLEIWTANADGSHAHQVTRMGAASFAPFFTPDGKRIIFASNPRDPHGRKFDLYLINVNGTDLERVTYSDTFDSFPMFSPDGKYLAFSSNRKAAAPHDTNVFIADWNNGPKRSTISPLSDDADPADRFFAVVQKLSSPEMEGRGLSTHGLELAEDFVVDQYKAIGLEPFFGADYKQAVDVLVHEKNQDHVLKGRNVVGEWGKGCGHVAPIVVGAHLDHLGYGSQDSLEPSQHGIHPGADDNASGVAAILEAARIIKTEADENSCFVFAAFTGEEAGIAGSSRFVEYLKSKHVHPKAMLNLDMVGRMENNQIDVFGTESAHQWTKLLTADCDERHLKCPGGGDGYGPSDHMSFYVAKIPVLHFFTGPHEDYHRTTDTADKINATGGIQAADLVAAVALDAADPEQALTYQKSKSPPMMGKLGRHSNGAYLGTIPDYSKLSSPHGFGEGQAESGGVPISGTRAGSPAEHAGVLGGDILVGIATADGVVHKIKNLDDFMAVLTSLKPGDAITLKIVRASRERDFPTMVGKRE
jgi:Tol biopolymer transport system component